MKKSILAIALTIGFASHALAYNEIVHRWSAPDVGSSQDAPKKLFNALKDDPRSVKTPSTGDVVAVEMSEGIGCSGPTDCFSWTHDGDQRSLKNSAVVYEALLAVGAATKPQIEVSTVECTKQSVSNQEPSYFCRLEETLSK